MIQLEFEIDIYRIEVYIVHRQVLMFRANVLPPSRGQKMEKAVLVQALRAPGG